MSELRLVWATAAVRETRCYHAYSEPAPPWCWRRLQQPLLTCCTPSPRLCGQQSLSTTHCPLMTAFHLRSLILHGGLRGNNVRFAKVRPPDSPLYLRAYACWKQRSLLTELFLSLAPLHGGMVTPDSSIISNFKVLTARSESAQSLLTINQTSSPHGSAQCGPPNSLDISNKQLSKAFQNERPNQIYKSSSFPHRLEMLTSVRCQTCHLTVCSSTSPLSRSPPSQLIGTTVSVCVADKTTNTKPVGCTWNHHLDRITSAVLPVCCRKVHQIGTVRCQ